MDTQQKPRGEYAACGSVPANPQQRFAPLSTKKNRKNKIPFRFIGLLCCCCLLTPFEGPVFLILAGGSSSLPAIVLRPVGAQHFNAYRPSHQN